MRHLLAACLLCLAIAPGPLTAQTASGAALERANAERQERGLRPLGTDPRLIEAARAQAAHMAKTGKMSHRGPRGRGVMDRVNRAGYRACFAAENVAFGQRDAAAVTTAWMNSQGHRGNILDRRATEGAVAEARSGDGTIYWAMVLAAPC